jgi:ribosome-associated protein
MITNNNNFTETLEEDDYVSKSAIKRYGKHLRELGKKIVELSQSEFERIPFEDDLSLKEACLQARKLKPSSEELRRELMHIEALLRKREDEIARYEDALKSIGNLKVANNTAFYRLEELRTKLIENGISEINNLISQNRNLDRQKLRALVSKAQKELNNENDTAKKNYRELFQYLKNNLL